MKKHILTALLALALAGCGSNANTEESTKPDTRVQESQTEQKDSESKSEKDEKPKEDSDASSGTARSAVKLSEDGTPATVAGVPIVNKKYSVSPDYAPREDPTAAAAAKELIAAMQSQGLDVSDAWSGFRSYEYQSELYNGYVASSGQEAADTFSARPGFSEHQTGLAFDLKHSSGALLENPAEAQWLLDHAHEYGFIVRYQEGWESITGYMAEPWHIRYLGDIAEEVHSRNVPLETYLGAEGGDYR